MTGTFVNTGAILVGSLVGLVAGRHLSERIKTTVMQGLGLSVILIGLQMALSGKEPLIAIGCLLLGALTVELFRIARPPTGRSASRNRVRTRVDAVYDWSRFNSLLRAYDWILGELAANRSAEGFHKGTLCSPPATAG